MLSLLPALTDTMAMPSTRPDVTIVHTYHGWDRPMVRVTVVDGERDGEYVGDLRASGTDADGDWWAMVTWTHRPGATFIDWFPHDQVVRVADLDDDAGRVGGPDRH